MGVFKGIIKWGLMGVGTLVVGIIVLALVFSGGGGDTDTVVKNNEASAGNSNGNEVVKNNEAKSETASADTSSEPKQKKVTAKIGDTLKVGNVAYTVKGTTTANTVGKFAPESASGKFLIVNMAVKNNGNQSITVNGSFFKIKSDGKTYSTDSMASTMANEAGGSFFMQQVNPGITKSGKIVFDIPPKMIGKNMKLQVQAGLFGTNEGIIKLSK